MASLLGKKVIKEYENKDEIKKGHLHTPHGSTLDHKDHNDETAVSDYPAQLSQRAMVLFLLLLFFRSLLMVCFGFSLFFPNLIVLSCVAHLDLSCYHFSLHSSRIS